MAVSDGCSAPLGAVCVVPLDPHNTHIDNGIEYIEQMRKLRLRKSKYHAQHHATRQLCDLGRVTWPAFVSISASVDG